MSTWNNQYLQQQQAAAAAQQAGKKEGTDGADSSPSSFADNPTSRPSDVFQWMRDRQNAFRDFQTSIFSEPTPLLTAEPGIVDSRRDLFTTPQQQQLTPAAFRHQVRHQEPPDSDPSRMLSTTRNSQEMAPKARVTYDEGKFQASL